MWFVLNSALGSAGGNFLSNPPTNGLWHFGTDEMPKSRCLKYASLDVLLLSSAICHIIRQRLYFDGDLQLAILTLKTGDVRQERKTKVNYMFSCQLSLLVITYDAKTRAKTR